MANESHLRVSNPPPRPLMIWDGECLFCKRWIERWREITAGKVDYATYQEAAARFPEIPIDQFKRAVAFIEPDGEVFFAAEAVYRSLRYRSSRKWLAWSYDHVPGFAGISETAYKFIARHRGLGSTFTRFLWGKDVRPPTYFWGRRCSFAGFNSWNRSRAFPRRPFRLLPVTHHCWTSVSQLSMGCSPAGDRLFVDLSRAMATMAAGAAMVAGISDPGYSFSGFTGGCVFAQVPSLQINAYVWRREADQRRRFLGLAESFVSLERPHSTRLSLLVATVAHSLRLVDRQNPGMV